MRLALSLLIDIGRISADILHGMLFDGLGLVECDCESSLDEQAVTLNGKMGGEDEIFCSVLAEAVLTR
jgi:hypothetical protein